MRFTQALLKDMKVQAIEEKADDLFLSWHVHIFHLNSRKHIIFINDLSRLCILISGVRTGQLNLLKEKFLETMKSYLEYEEISKTQIENYLKHGTDICISKTNSRSVLATMTEITIFDTDDFDNDLERMKWLNRLIYKPINYNKPIEVFTEQLEKINSLF
ncbi:DUF6933 domain-containing protein [Cohnella sp. 56]|uniref:DUF6933 domain-containing protein n=1 Tax=Cohnella sp. 56 TaxID=3113722 RepID=UPI0030E8A1E8